MQMLARYLNLANADAIHTQQSNERRLPIQRTR